MLRKPSVLGLKTIILLCTSYMTLYNIDINQNVNFICYEIQYNTKNCCHIYSLLPYFGFPHSKNAYWTKQFTWKPWLLALHSEACNCVLEKLSLKLENDCSSHCVQPIVNHWVSWFRARSLNTSLKPFLTTGGWQLEKCVYWNLLVSLKWVLMSSLDCCANLSPL